MGAAKALDLSDLVMDAVGTASAVASGAAKQVVQSATSLVTSGALSGAVRFAGGAVARVNPYIGLGMGAYDLYQFLTQEEKAKLSAPELVAVQTEENIAKTMAQTQEKAKELGEKTKAIDDSVVYEQGQSLPSVLSQNAKALTQSINNLTLTMNEQLGLLNNYLMAFAIYQQQLLDVKVKEADMKVESMTYAKTAQSVKDLDGQVVASFAPREASLVKDVTLAKDTTDKINFDIDDLIDEVSVPIEFGGYPLTFDIMEEFIRKAKGL